MNIGITGSIACGKSTVSDYLIAKGYTIIDADKLGHVALTSKVVKIKLAEKFVDEILEKNEERINICPLSIAENYMRASWCCDVYFTRPVNAEPTGIQKYMCHGFFPHGERMLPRFFLYVSLYLLHLIGFQTKISESHEDF